MQTSSDYGISCEKRYNIGLDSFAANRGFALLITITLVAFLVIIVVAVSSLTRVETRVADNSQQLNQARQNAITALNLAVGRLQEFVGPDDRHTARADLTTSGPSSQPYLTGVWRSANGSGTPDAWLVSGDSGNPLDTSDVLDPATGSGLYHDGSSPWVFLLAGGSVDADAERVRLAKRTITAPAGAIPGLSSSGTIGHYAWWIGDQGIKASASLVDPLLLPNAISYDNSGTPGDDWTDTVKRDRLNQLQLPRPRIERLFPALTPDVATPAAQRSRGSESAQLDMVATGPTAAQRKAAFHAITPLAEAVLLDPTATPAPRLRRDLSDPAGATALNDAVRAYRDFRVSIPDAVTEPYVAVYHPSAATATTPNVFPAFSAGPVMTEFGLRAYFTLGGAGGDEIILNTIVEAELWNPYAARLETAAGQPLSLIVDGDLEVTVNDNLGGSFTVNIADLIRNANGDVAGAPVGVLIDAAETWAPGEVRVVAGSTTLTTGGAGGVINTGQTATAGSTALTSVNLPALTGLDVSLRVNPTAAAPVTVQRYNPDKTYTASSAPNPGTYAFGYGYNYIDELDHWTGDSAGADPRRPELTGAFHDPSGSWDGSDAANNAGLSPDNVFAGLTSLVLFDLPRQELVSVGDLRQLAGEFPAELGNPWGTTNAWFDGYFFSTVPQNHAWNFAANEPLPNRYVRYLESDRGTPALTDLRNVDNAARYLLARGAFNLNSTSVDAWRAVLGPRIANWSRAGAVGTQTLNNVFLRLPHGAQQAPNAPVVSGASIPDADAVTTGGRQVIDAEIDELATGIVTALKTRGRPFTSIREFLDGGVLADAIAAANLNAPALNADFRAAPGAVIQADIAAGLAPILTARSDTFVVRAYGDAWNPVTNTASGRAWCEAVVQRVPDVTDPAGGAYASGDEIQIDPAKYPFGRKFKIISFRWLTSDDI